MDAKLGRAVLTQVEGHPEQFDMTIWGETGRPCGATACLAGWALILSGWSLVDGNDFQSPDGKREIVTFDGIEEEARTVLQLTEDEYWDDDDANCLFTLPGDAAVKRLRELVEAAEEVASNG